MAINPVEAYKNRSTPDEELVEELEKDIDAFLSGEDFYGVAEEPKQDIDGSFLYELGSEDYDSGVVSEVIKRFRNAGWEVTKYSNREDSGLRFKPNSIFQEQIEELEKEKDLF